MLWKIWQRIKYRHAIIVTPIIYAIRYFKRRFNLNPVVGGRRIDPNPVACSNCGWMGMVKSTIHGYGPLGIDDVEPVDECPKCRSEI